MLSEEVIEKMREFCSQEDKMLWQMGDYLNEHRLTDDEMTKLAGIVQRRVVTLRLREQVAREFPVGVRDHSQSWSVYRELLKVKTSEARTTLLASRDEWTAESIRYAITEHNDSIAVAEGRKVRSGRPVGGAHAGMRVGDVLIRGELRDGELTITIDREVLEPVRVLPGVESTLKISFS